MTAPEIVERTFRLSLRIVKASRTLPNDPAGTAMARQLVRAEMSVGANVEEAQAAHSKKDFTRRMNIALAEARESLYWLRLATESGLFAKVRVGKLITDTDEVVRILTAIVKNSKRKPEGA